MSLSIDLSKTKKNELRNLFLSQRKKNPLYKNPYLCKIKKNGTLSITSKIFMRSQNYPRFFLPTLKSLLTSTTLRQRTLFYTSAIISSFLCCSGTRLAFLILLHLLYNLWVVIVSFNQHLSSQILLTPHSFVHVYVLMGEQENESSIFVRENVCVYGCVRACYAWKYFICTLQRTCLTCVSTVYTRVMNDFLRRFFHLKDKGSFVTRDMLFKRLSLTLFLGLTLP